MDLIQLYFKNLYTLFIDMSFYMVIGLIFTGLLHVFVNKEWITKQVGKKGIGSVIKSSLIGVPLPLCSCGVVPTAIELGKNGATRGAVTSFLTSTPQTGVDSIIATYGMMGGFFAFFRAIAAFISGIVTGLITDIFVKDEEIHAVHISCGCGCHSGESHTDTPVHSDECGCHTDHAHTDAHAHVHTSGCGCHTSASHSNMHTGFFTKLKEAFNYAFADFLSEIAKHFLIGLLIAALISTLIPTNSLSQFSGTIIPLFAMLVIGIPMYVCSTSSIPIALSLINTGLTPGAAFVFLFSGPVTNIASLSILVKSLGKKTVAIYLLCVSICALIFGFLLDLLPISTIGLSNAHLDHSQPPIFTLIVAGFFLICLLRSIYMNNKHRFSH